VEEALVVAVFVDLLLTTCHVVGLFRVEAVQSLPQFRQCSHENKSRPCCQYRFQLALLGVVDTDLEQTTEQEEEGAVEGGGWCWYLEFGACRRRLRSYLWPMFLHCRRYYGEFVIGVGRQGQY
jgi:hypothetical protein